jgi:hypothetical protein
MTSEEYCRRLRHVIYTAGVNARYHQFCEARSGRWDQAIRIAVGVLATVGLILSVPGFDKLAPQVSIPWVGFCVAIISLVAALILNIVPVTDRAKFHGEMFRAWSELRRAGLLEEQKTCEINPKEFHIDRLAELVSEVESLNTEEPFPDIKLLKKCQDDENETEWGAGIRTAQQVEAERERLLQRQAPCPPPAASASEASAAGQGQGSAAGKA